MSDVPAESPAAAPAPSEYSTERFALFAQTLTAHRRASHSALAAQAERATQRAAAFSSAFSRALLSDVFASPADTQQEPAGSAP